MSVLDQVIQMRNQGIPEEEIINHLKDQGVTPKAISDALSQAEIKSAVSSETNEAPYPESFNEYPQTYNANAPYPNANVYSPQTQEMPKPYNAPQEEYYPMEGYQEYAPEQGVSSDTLIEISEQVFAEKIKKIQKQIDILNEFMVLAKTKIENNSERLKRIEETFDRLQSAILEKIGSYGSGLESIKKEMSMMQDSFGKIVTKTLEKTEQKHSQKNVPQETEKPVKKKTKKQH